MRLSLVMALAAAPAAAQLALPRVGVPPVPVEGILGGVAGTLDKTTDAAARVLAKARQDRLARLVRSKSGSLEFAPDGAPARRGEILVFQTGHLEMRSLRAAGFGVVGEEVVEGLDLRATRLSLPAGIRLRDAGRVLERAAPGLDWAPDHVYEQAGRGDRAARQPLAAQPISTPVGIIDGASGPATSVAAVKGFARGAPVASNHGSAIASLLARAGVRRILVADVYGTDPAGGSASAIARGMGWLVASGAKVITVSLVGPENTLLGRAIAAARARGVVVVAAVGNDGPASPPSFPASYPGVVSVTAVDGRKRALIEAGRALDLDYAAPGADIAAMDARGRSVKLRGTSYAVPTVASRIAAENGSDWRSKLDSDAEDLGRKGPDPVYGRGLICGKYC